MRSRVRRGEAMPAFGHPLYPDGDPRAAVIMAEVGRATPRPAIFSFHVAVDRAASAMLGVSANIDFALTVLERAFGLPRGAAPALFAIARSVGWIAHAQEQYADGRLIRPRARYTGEPPQDWHENRRE